MASSPEAICNQALGWLGANLMVGTVAVPDPNEKQDVLCAANYEPLRDAVLSEHDWQFAIKRTTLTTAGTGVDWGYTYAYTPPADMIKPIEARDVDPKGRYIGEGGTLAGASQENRLDWAWEGGQILVNNAEPFFIYVARITDTTQFPSYFDQTLAQRLAADLAIPLVESRSMQEAHWQLYQGKKAEAIATDSVHSGRRKQIYSSGLRRVR